MPLATQATFERRTPSLRIALICMPWASTYLPSIQVGLLTAVARDAGYATDSWHLNLDLASELTNAVYSPLSFHRGRLTGEWLFSVAAFGDDAPSSVEDFLAAFPDEARWFKSLGIDAEALRVLRNRVLPRFVDRCLKAIPWADYDVVGFTSTFQQNVASLALARRIKAAHPQVQIVFGGANMEDEMGPEFARAFNFIDYVVVGEGDAVFPALLRQIGGSCPTTELQGVAHRVNGRVETTGQSTPVTDLDALPIPVYDEFFTRAQQLGIAIERHARPAIAFESSRGCWWGQKHHCTFCGLNGVGMSFRKKTPERVIRELHHLGRAYNVGYFEATDNILDMGYVTNLFGRLRTEGAPFSFFYEVKANLTRDQIATLAAGGLRSMQPGIESMSTEVLKLMRKGSTMLHNVRLLKWCRYHGITVSWNVLYGFPGEREDQYREQLDVLKVITHLEPPQWVNRIWLERFSPYYFDRVAFPARFVKPERSYAHVYPSDVDLTKAAYYFDYEMDNTVADSCLDDTRLFVRAWQERWHSSRDALEYRRSGDAIAIDDTRNGYAQVHVLEPFAAALYESCGDTWRTPEQLDEELFGVAAASHTSIRDTLDDLCERGLMLSEDGRYLSLAVPASADR